MQYGQATGWGVSGWADIGEGADSSSYQLAGFVSYSFENGARLFGGYRQYSFEYEIGSGASLLRLDLDFKGPMMGVTYRF